jgi:DNA-binding LacI/PurR family transcriptional regulator
LATIKDVAKQANVSVATVSRVVNNTGYVNTETRNMVLDAIKSLDYIPNELARSLFKKQSNLIGVIVPHLSTYFFAELIEALEDVVSDKGYRLMIFNSRNDKEREIKFLNVFSQYHISGLLVVAHLNALKEYKKLELPMVAIDHHVSDKIPSVSSDNVLGGKLAAEHFIKSNAKKLIHFRGASFLLTVRDRDKGFKKALKDYPIEIIDCDLDFITPDMNMIKETLKTHSDCDGIFCDGDVIAMHVLKVSKDLGFHVPNDFEIIGFDDLKMNQFISPMLSSIHQDIHGMAQKALESLIQIINDSKAKIPNHLTLPLKLIERESTKKAVN